MRLFAILLSTASAHAGILLLQASGTFPGGTPDTIYSQAGKTFLFSIEMDSNPVPLDTFPPDTTLVSTGPWSYALAGKPLAGDSSGAAFLYLASRGGLFDLCADSFCETTIGLAGDPLISSLDSPVLAVGVYSGTDFAYFDGATFVHFPASATVTITPIPEPSTWMTFGAGLFGLLWVVAFSRRRFISPRGLKLQNGRKLSGWRQT